MSKQQPDVVKKMQGVKRELPISEKTVQKQMERMAPKTTYLKAPIIKKGK